MKKSKKVLALLISAFISMIWGLPNVFASTLNMDFTGYWFERSDNGNNYASWKLNNYYIDGNVAFCIEPGIAEGNPMHEGSWEDTGLSNNVKQKVLLLSYYGYQYTGHQTQEYRAATQALIWEAILGGNTKVTYNTERYGRGTPYNVDAEKSIINNLVSKHYTKPSFNGTTITSEVGKPVTLTDTNDVLSNYEVYASNNAEVSIDGNKLIITPTEIGNVNLQFVKKQIYTRSYIIYLSDEYQNMISGGNIDPVYFSINVKGLGGKLELNKVDSTNTNNTPQGEATLEGAKFNIIDNNGDVVQTLTTDKNGHAVSDYLPYFGTYTLKEVSPSKGYLLNNEVITFDITKENKISYVTFKENVITRKFEFTKIYASDKTGIMTPEIGVKFGIYDKNNNLVVEKTTNADGKIIVTLPYGEYTLKQLTSTYNYEKIQDYKFEVKETGDTVNKIFGNAQTKARLKVVKVDEETGEVIKRANIKFKIFDVNKNEYVFQTITYPFAKTIDVFETDSNGVLITPYPLNSGTYYLEEVDQAIEGYLWNDKSILFEISEDANLVLDDEFGILLEVKFANSKVKGEIKINKTGEIANLLENGYVYTQTELEGVKFCIYTKDGKEVSCGLTDKDGILIFKDLDLGDYYVLEVKTLDGYILDKTKHEVSLKYKDQYTPVISYKLSLENRLPKGKLEFTKADLSTGDVLPNTLIEIYTDKDELVFSGRTNENGLIIIDNLPVGKYYILEKEAPENYKINEDKMSFEITEDGQIIKCSMKDERYEVPSTGLSEIDYKLIGSIALMITGLGLYIYGNKKRK